jgi:ubiquinone/menaquinone biosynthesis C-methylase UbiE
MQLGRTLEPEVMDTEEEASDYDSMDHAEVNSRFCDDLLSLDAGLGPALLDAGTGTARIPIELCRRVAGLHVVAIDLAESMRVIARRNVDQAGLAGRIELQSGDAKSTRFGASSFDSVISNSLAHHIPDPGRLMRELWRLLRPGGVLFVRDLARPASAARLGELVGKHASIPEGLDPARAAMHARQRALFEASLHAALTVDEVGAIVEPLGVPREAVRLTSDRHWTLAWTKKR